MFAESEEDGDTRSEQVNCTGDDAVGTYSFIQLNAAYDCKWHHTCSSGVRTPNGKRNPNQLGPEISYACTAEKSLNCEMEDIANERMQHGVGDPILPSNVGARFDETPTERGMFRSYDRAEMNKWNYGTKLV